MFLTWNDINRIYANNPVQLLYHRVKYALWLRSKNGILADLVINRFIPKFEVY